MLAGALSIKENLVGPMRSVKWPGRAFVSHRTDLTLNAAFRGNMEAASRNVE